MFTWKDLRHYLKVTGLVLGALGALVAAPALAAGESYSWQDSTNQAVVATGGAFGTNSLTLGQTGKDSQNITFANANPLPLTCNGKSTPVTVTLTVASASQATAPSPAAVSVSPNCPDANLDSSVQIAAASTTATGSSTAGGTTESKTCDQGTMSWLACPLMDNISRAISNVAQNVLVPLLKVNSISQQNTPGLYQAWNGVKNFAEVLFILLFLVTIFSTALSIGFDQYTIKRILPRLIAAAVLIQFSFFICSFLVDMGNILGSGIGGIIAGATPVNAVGPSDANSVLNISALVSALAVGGLAIYASLALAGPILLMLLLSVLAFLLTLGARYIIIAVLVVVSPLAIVAWVLPNTEGYFKKWGTTLVKLILMYPIIIGILSFGSRINEILGPTSDTATNGFTGTLADVIKPFVIIVLFLAIPRTFKWAGGMMGTAQSTFNNLASRGRKGIKGSDWYKERAEDRHSRQVEMMRKFSNNKVTGMNYLNTSSSKGAKVLAGMQRTVAGAMLAGAPSTSRSLQRSFSKQVGAVNKELGELEAGADVGALMTALNASYGTKEDRAKARAALALNEPALLRYTETQAGRISIVKQLSNIGLFGDAALTKIAKHQPSEYGDVLRASGKGFKGSPPTFARFAEGEFEIKKDGTKIAHKAGDIKEDALRSSVSGWDAQTIRADLKPEPWSVARKESVVSRIIGESTKYTVYDDVLSSNSRVRAQAPKRAEIYKWLAERRSELEAQGGNAAEILRVAKDHITDNQDIFDDLVKYAWTGDDGKTRAYTPGFSQFWSNDPSAWSAAQREQYIRGWMDGTV